MTEKQFEVTNISKNGNTGLFWFGKDNLSVYDIVRLLNELFDENKELTEENERLNRINKGQELEIVRLHHLADAMSGALRELGIYNVYDDKMIEEIKNKLKGGVE